MSPRRISQSLLWVTLLVSLVLLGAHSMALYFLATTTCDTIIINADSRWVTGLFYLFPLLATALAFSIDRKAFRSRIGMATAISVSLFYAVTVTILVVCRITGTLLFL